MDTKKIPTHSIKNLTNSPYPMRTKSGYDRIVPAFTEVTDIPAPSFLENLNTNFWEVKALALTAEDEAALLADQEAEKARADEEARLVKQAEEDAIKAQAEADAEAAKKGEKK